MATRVATNGATTIGPFQALMDLGDDAFTMMPKLLNAVGVARTLLAAAEAGKLPVVTPAELATLDGGLTDIEKMVADIEAL